MSVPDQPTIFSYTGNGVTTTYAYGFYLLSAEDIVVSVNGAEVTSGFTVNGIGAQSGGAVIFSAPPADDVPVVLYRNVAIERDTDYQRNGDLRADTLNNDFDRLWMALQDFLRDKGISLRYPIVEQLDGELPPAGARMGNLLGFDTVTGRHMMVPLPSSIGGGDLMPFSLVSGVDFAPGATTLPLPREPGSNGNIQVNFDGFSQDFTQWSVAGQTLTVPGGVPGGVTRVWGYIGTNLSILIPPDNSVGDDELTWGTVLHRVVDSIAALRALPKARYKRAFATGYYGAGDLGGGEYWQDPLDTTSPDDGGSVIVADDGARWKLKFISQVSAGQFGVKADNTGNDGPAIQNAILAVNAAGGGTVLLPTGSMRLTSQVLLYPNVHVAGQGMGRSSIQWVGALATTVFRTTSNTPGLLSLGGSVRDVTINGQVKGNGITAIDISDGRDWRIHRVEFANCLYGIHFNKYATAVGSAFGGQAYFNVVEQCEFVLCTSAAAFGGASNRNTFSTNTLRDCDVAYDFGIAGNVSETNVFINENVEGCRSWAEWSGVLANIYSQTWIGLTVENPTTNGFTCNMRDPGRQNFVGLTIIPANNPAAVSFFNLFTDGSGKAIRSDVFGTQGSSGGYTGYGNRSIEDLHLLADTTTGGNSIRTRAFGESAVINQTITPGNFVQVNFAVPGARIGDAIAWSISTLYPTLTINGPVVAANDVVSFSLYNNSAANIAVNAKLYAAVAARPTTL